MSKYIRLLAALVLVAGCGSSENNASGGGGGDPGGTGGPGSGSGGGKPLEGFSVNFDPITVQPGQEDTQCVLVRLPNPEALHVNTIHNELGPGSHHLIVYRTTDTEEQRTPFPCQPFVDLLTPEKGAPLMITQKPDDVLTLPKGVAFSLEKQQMLRLEMHYINTTPDPIEVTAKSTFVPMPESEFEHEADFVFFGNPDIDLPPHGSQTLGPTFLPMPQQLAGAKFFGVTGHTHQWGTNVTVGSSETEGGAPSMIYDVGNWKWDEPPTVYLDPPLELPTGGGFHLTCTYTNGSEDNIGFGESATEEMCFFWTYYYPSAGAFVCAHTDQIPGGYDLCCPGNPLCSQIFQ
jgi:hypothetical protein